ncbi:uncharacterized protein A4U43_C08F22120 [Asparagus officinalis]|nr:uncharacterized protein A4U43_C08F22120 [Asparagus officinalis]
MDCRARLNPPVSDDYLGNCVLAVMAKCMAGELTGEQGLVKACTSIRKSIDQVSKDPLSGYEDQIADFKSLPIESHVNATASPRFRVYEADFGWGAPDRFESVSMNLNGEFALVGGREEGTVQVSVQLDEGRMEKFAHLFLGGFSR